MKEEKAKHFFALKDDLNLLKQVLADPPFCAKHGGTQQKWEDIQTKLNPDVTWRTIRDRFTLLVKQFKTATSENLKKSGTEEEFTEKEVLLQEIVDLMRESETQKDSAKNGVELRENSLKQLNQTETILYPTPKRKKEVDFFKFLEEKRVSQAETALRKHETEKKTWNYSKENLFLKKKSMKKI